MNSPTNKFTSYVQKLTIDESNALYIMKALCLLSIVCAHSAYTKLESPIAISLFNRFSDTGVFAFFVLSGFFFHYTTHEAKLFMKKKLVYIIQPWVFLGILTYAIRFITEKFYFSPLEIINWLLGNGTYLWFLPVLLICETAFMLIPRKAWSIAAGVCIVSTVISVNLTAYGVLPISTDEKSLAFTTYNVYLNIFNWIGMFASGILLKKSSILKKLISLSALAKIIISIACISVFYLISASYKAVSYWAPLSLVTESLAFILYFLFAYKLKNIKILLEIGKATLPIYVLHLPIIGILNEFLSTSIIFTAIRPAIVVLIIFFCLKMGSLISNSLKIEALYHVLVDFPKTPSKA